ncbi:MAG TPA: MBL fold metallo-hydrolase [Jatrophihabitantaceae bacterium]|jgi:glyoxylase-like metal-dependent hydrolase (beta-lactamase superfamily II)
MLSRAVGAATIVALDDGTAPYFRPRRDAFPTATDEHWQRADQLDPAAVDDGEWRLRFHCFAIRSDAGVTLVDAGIGPAADADGAWSAVPGQLPDELAAAGIDPAEVDTVVLTHLHSDHIGWAALDEPYFGNAMYVLQQAEWAALDKFGPAARSRVVEPLQARDQLRLLDGDARLNAASRIVATPGHTPGHQSVLVEAGDTTVAITGDLLVHAIQLVDPDLAYLYEDDPALARESRIRLLQGNPVLATSHLGKPYVETW